MTALAFFHFSIILFCSPVLWTAGPCYLARFFSSCLVLCFLDSRTVLCCVLPASFMTGSYLPIWTPRQRLPCSALRTLLDFYIIITGQMYMVYRNENRKLDPGGTVDPRGERWSWKPV